MVVVAASIWIMGAVLYHFALRAMAPGDPRWTSPSGIDAIAAGIVVVSLTLFFYAQGHDRDPRFVLNLGLVYFVLTSLALCLVLHSGPGHRPSSIAPTVSWIGAVILTSAALVPSTPRRTLVTGLLAASMNPVAMLLAHVRGTWDFGPLYNVLVMHYPDYLLVGVAVVISHVMTNLGQQVVQAREMGSYQVGELLGRGGMGEVYKATHRMLARPAAIKLIRPERLGAGHGESAAMALKRFRREAEVAARLRSPHTVGLYDFGVTENQTFYLVMELLEGMDLEALVSQTGPVPANRVIYILRQVCESLEEAHTSGLVHRDIKPANIHVGRLGLQYDFVKVLDFGLVKSTLPGDADESLGTAAGLTLGTPAYMAPEMALDDACDGRVDLYSLGCVAYFMLSGKRVFEGTNYVQIIAKHLREDPLPLSERTSLPIPVALERAVHACLAKKPGQRPQSAAELARSLAAIEMDPWCEDQARQWWQGRPAV